MSTIPDNLIIVPYQPHLAEYAWLVRKTLSNYYSKDCIIAVDLPQSLEYVVLSAVQELPRISNIIDPLGRSIPIIPTSAPIEAVRCYLEVGQDLVFLDTPFPICCPIEIWEEFLGEVHHHGLPWMMEHSNEVKIDIWPIIDFLRTKKVNKYNKFFNDIPDLSHVRDSLLDPWLNETYYYRRIIMATRLKELLIQGMDVIFVCNELHCSYILDLIHRKIEGDKPEKFVFPTRTCQIGERDILKITEEIPYHIYLYEIFRGCSIDRDLWNNYAISKVEVKEDVETITNIITFARKIALLKKRRNPDLSCILTASRCCTHDLFTNELKRVLQSYPPCDKESSETIEHSYDYNFMAIDEQDPEDLQKPVSWNQSINKKVKIREGNASKVRKVHRTRESIQNENKARKYLSSKFKVNLLSDEITALPFIQGMGDGIAVRESLRDIVHKQIFVKYHEVSNNAAYVFDFGGTTEHSLYYFRSRALIGFAQRVKKYYSFTQVAIFAESKREMKWWLESIDKKRPLQSILKKAFEHSDTVYLFSHHKPQISIEKEELKKLVILPLTAIPDHVLSWVRYIKEREMIT